MTNEPLVSILIPAYNAEKWIRETLRSAVDQTWKNKEIIVVDDGSTDDTMAAAAEFSSQGVRVHSQINQGAAAARNMAFRLSTGDYIQWLDADDLLSPEKIALQMACRTGTRTLLSSEWATFLYRPDRAAFAPTSLWQDQSPADWLRRKLSENLYMQTATWLVSRELTQSAGDWNTKMLTDDDGEYFCRVLLASDGVRFVPGAKVYYRHCGTASLSYIGRSERKANAHWDSMKLHIKCLRSLEESDRVRRACLTYMHNWLIHFYPERTEIVADAKQLAHELGGNLKEPELSWKYQWIRALLGWNCAKDVQLSARNLRWSVQREWDRWMSGAGHQNQPGLTSGLSRQAE